MATWDPHGQQHLESIRASLVEVGVVDLVRREAIEVWRANRERYEPDELHDDAFTLGVLSSRNLSNRILDQVGRSESWRAAGVSAAREFTGTVVRTPSADVRLVKAPHSTGREPVFRADFEWNSSESRLAAAARNRAVYPVPPRQPGAEPLFELNVPGAAQAVKGCRDAFLVWGAEIENGLTAGWLGLPTTSSDRWIAVIPAWWDEASAPGVAYEEDGSAPNSEAGFGARPAPVPTITLKRVDAEGFGR
ncbi:hypothetical protein G1H11_12370 [Phytoactinopolyspora alkaliphila]|uniref:Uncharacterized protein n=1 Tax=Phytoactinopolyspora alkaliphila TaxID=1783498 RepID=A0A6N9YM80_9ACTN|nr:hypothetical protein [Phytoactinopolyspora alkaliphila]NED96103.1 hypothetical protein [Phytoactinopolyspora alkaliphila]